MLQREHSAILSTFISYENVINNFVLSIFDWPFYTGFTVVPLTVLLYSISTLSIRDMKQHNMYIMKIQKI